MDERLIRIPGQMRDTELPETFGLEPNFPNPFNLWQDLRTVISYSLPLRTPVRLSVHNFLGQEVATLVQAVQDPGRYVVTWSGRDGGGARVRSGVYFYRIEAGEFSQTRRMVLMR